MTFSGAALAPVSGEDERSERVTAGEVEIARRTFRAVGGDLVLVEFAASQNVWIASLPLAK